MQSNLSTHVEPRLPLIAADTAEVVPPVQMPYLPANLDQYSSVCVHVREASFIASNDPIACNHPAALPAIAQTRQTGSNSAASGGFGAANFGGAKAKGNYKRRMLTGQKIGWICVAQLGVIIGMLGGQAWHIDQAAKSIKDSLWAAAAPGLGLMFHGSQFGAPAQGLNGANSSMGHAVSVAPKKNGKTKVAKYKKGSSSAMGWPVAKEFIPPPPPSIPGAKMMVPPPPVAFSLFDKAPGAVAASTLPNALVPVVKELKEKPEAKEHKQPLEPAPEQRTIGMHAEVPTISSGAIPPVIDAPPSPSQKAAETAGAPAPGALATAVPQIAPPSVPSLAHPATPISVPNTMPVVRQTVPVAHAAPAPAPIRTVISGHRKRTITDR